MKLFKRKNKINIPLENNQNVKQDIKHEISKYEVPKICMLNCSEKTFNTIESSGYSTFNGSLGKKIRIENLEYNKGVICHPKTVSPKNLHEYDIIVVDLLNEEFEYYNPVEHTEKENRSANNISLFCMHPQTIFDPTSFSLNILNNQIYEFKQKESIVIVFANHREIQKYIIGEMKKDYMRGEYFDQKKVLELSNYGFLYNWPIEKNLSGNKANLDRNISGALKSILEPHINSLQYHITFRHPKTWKDDEQMLSPYFLPLIRNQKDEILSYYTRVEKTHLFVFPEITDQATFLTDFLDNYAPELASSIFPFSEKLLWKKRSEYYLPNQSELLDKKERMIQKYEDEIKKIDEEVKENETNYDFLHQIITETGDELVKSVIKFFKWLGVSNIKNMDEENEVLLEEDIQIETSKGLLLIEVKGIGGTSKDSECSQISKNIPRRMKQLNRTDVYGLYLVNHQRHKPPLERQNPPFLQQQIEDALSDERGLLTTWQLFQLYKNIEIGLIEKKQVIEELTNYGLIEFEPKFNNNYDINNLYKNNTVVSITLSSEEIKVGDFIYSLRDGFYTKHEIIEIQINKKNVEKADNGKVGLLLNIPVKPKSKICTK